MELSCGSRTVSNSLSEINLPRLNSLNSIVLNSLRDLISETTDSGGTWKPDNLLKGIWNIIPQNLDNPRKGIRELLPNGIRSQWLGGLIVPT